MNFIKGLLALILAVNLSSCNPLGVDDSMGSGGAPKELAFISSVTPSIGDVSGGASLTIKGGYFEEGSKIFIGDTECSNISIVSAKQIDCTSPSGSIGLKDVKIVDKDGREYILEGSFTYVVTYLDITGPNGGVDFTTQEVQATVHGNCSKNLSSLTSILGTFADDDCSDGNWSLNVFSLTPGLNSFVVSGSTPDGEASDSATIKINYDNIPTVISITAPNNGDPFSTSVQLQTVSGTCSTDTTNLTTSLGTFMDDDCSDGAWSLNPYLLAVGANNFVVSGEDPFSVIVSDSVTITYDILAPTVNITSPNAGIDFVTNEVIQDDISGTCSTDVVTLNSSLGTFLDDDCSDGDWKLNPYFLTVGANTFNITAFDSAGNSSNATLTITYDSTAPDAPIVTAVSPTTDTTPTWSWSSGGGGSGNYRYKLDDPNLNIGATETTSTNYTPGVSLSIGLHTLYVQERDEALNWSSSGSKNVLIEECRPVLGWGRNNAGQLGTNVTLPYRTTPVDGPSLTDVIKVTSGQSFSVAVKSDGTVWTWGLNDTGQLASGNLGSRSSAEQLQTISNVTDASSGTGHTIVLKGDGTVWGWGLNTSSQLGDLTATNKLSPVQTLGNLGVGVLNNITKVDAGAAFSIALKNDNTVWTWGANTNGQLGDNSTTTRTTPVQVVGAGGVGFLTNVTSISAGASHTLAVKSDGTVWAWGLQTNGRLGNNQTAAGNITTPVQVQDLLDGSGFLTGVVAVSAGGSHSMALKSDGTVYTWGLNTNGQIGDNTVVQKATAVQVTTISNVASISAGTSYSSAIKNDNTLWMWGLNTSYQLGDGTATQRTVPVQIAGVTDALQVKASVDHTIMRTTTGSIKVWGINSNGQLGNEIINQVSPVAVYGFESTPLLDISGGTNHSLMLKTDNTVWSMGLNSNGQLGDNTTVQKNTPVQVKGTGGVGTLTDVVSVSSGGAHSIAAKSDGTVWAWGLNTNGRLGDNTTTQRLAPVQVHGVGNIGFLTDVVKVVASNAHSVALKNDGTVYAWGLGTSGQLGDGTIVSKSVPVQVLVNNIVDIIASNAGSFTLALKNDGTVWSWGLNTNGQLGDGTVTLRSTPVQVMNLSNVISIGAGTSHSLAIKSDGSVWAWGLNSNYQLGDGTNTQRNQPVEVLDISDAVDLSAGAIHSYAVKSDGSVWAWGSTNNYGQLGDGTAGLLRISPVEVNGFEHTTKIGAGDYHGLAIQNCSY